MAFLLDGQAIRSPNSMSEANNTQYAQQRTLSGNIGRDYFGSNKRVWTLKYDVIQKSAYDTINTIYQSYLSTGSGKTWEITETNYTVSQTTVHINLEQREFSIGGENYLSEITLILTEA